MKDNKGQSITSSMVYKSLERYVVLAFQTIVQIVIARILSPSDYGIVAMMTVFINVAQVFIANGFNSAVIQKKEANNRDFGTALLLNFMIGLFIYTILFFAAPAISHFYNEPQLKLCLRVLALTLPIGSVSSIQMAIAVRRMMFRNVFVCNVIGSVSSGIVGITMAWIGFGYWALIGQQLTSVFVVAIALTYHATWKPRFDYVKSSAKEMFVFGWKMLGAGLINTIYNELNSLIIGKKYTSADLSYYTKGRTFPNTITSGVDSSLQSVLLSSMSKKQEDEKELHRLIHISSVANSYLLLPILCFLAVAGDNIISLLLTDKWLPMVPFMQICCFTYAFHPVASINMQVIAAVGRSDMRLKLEFIKKPFGIIMLILAIPYGPIGIAISAAITSVFSLLVGYIACQRIVHYRIIDSLKDLYPAWVVALVAGAVVYLMNGFDVNKILLLVLQLVAMTAVYYLLSRVFNLLGYRIFKEKVHQYKHKLPLKKTEEQSISKE